MHKISTNQFKDNPKYGDIATKKGTYIKVYIHNHGEAVSAHLCIYSLSHIVARTQFQHLLIGKSLELVT